MKSPAERGDLCEAEDEVVGSIFDIFWSRRSREKVCVDIQHLMWKTEIHLDWK